MIDLEYVKTNRDWQFFVKEDPFNNNLVSGYISHHHGDDYGAVFIEEINYKSAPQLILCTPKMGYPFDRSGNWHFPKAKKILRYEKLDGTNVFAYRYFDGKNVFVTYKTRLLPFIQESKFGPFLSMWKEMLSWYVGIPKICISFYVDISFEMWGARNPHLVRYEKPLEVSWLFCRTKGKITPPMFRDVFITFPKAASFRGEISGNFQFQEEYGSAKVAIENSLKELEDGYLGCEGEVWYLLDEHDNWTQFKCKPETIEQIHWSQGGIGKNIIRATIENSFENWDNPTSNQIKQLLREEFSESEIEKVHYSIEKQLKEAISNHEFVLEVMKEYTKTGLNVLVSKREVMRALSSKFNKNEMKRVYSIIEAEVAK